MTASRKPERPDIDAVKLAFKVIASTYQRFPFATQQALWMLEEDERQNVVDATVDALPNTTQTSIQRWIKEGER